MILDMPLTTCERQVEKVEVWKWLEEGTAVRNKWRGGERLNLEQAIAASHERCACRIVGSLRVIVAMELQTLNVCVQRRVSKRWIIDDDGGGIRYLPGVLRGASGIYHIAGDTLFRLNTVRTMLPEHYRLLLVPECDDWQAIERYHV